MKTHKTNRFFAKVRAKGMLCGLSLSIFSLLPLTAPAQDIDFNAGCPNADDVLPPVTAGTAISPPISIGTVNAPGAVSMEIQTTSLFSGGVESPICGTPCTSPQSILGVNLSVAGTGDEVTVDGTPDSALSGSDLRFTLRATSNAVQCDRSYSLAIQRTPLDLAVVLDRSGSMGWAYDGSFSPPAGQRRWDGLITGVGAMSAQFEATDLLTDDNVGMRYFASSVIVPAAPFNGGLVSMETNIDQLDNTANAETPGGSTGLGDAILAARDLLLAGPASHRKAMIVFSDGAQNTGDQVKTVNPNAYTQTVSGQELNGPSDEIDIYTVALGSSGFNPFLMQQIAAANGGEYMNSQAGAETDFITFFSLHVDNILLGSSPQHVDIVKDSFPITGPSIVAPATSQSFTVNKGVANVQVIMFAPSRREPHFISITKDGVELIQEANTVGGSNYRSIAVKYPVSAVPGGTLDGEWTVQASLGTHPESQTPYTMMFLVDDHLTDVDYDIGGSQLKVGQPINPSVGLTWNGEAIANGSVKAIIVKPGDDINDLLAKMDADFKVAPEDPGTPDVAKLAVLMQDQAFLDKIAASDQLVNLAYDSGEERYKGSFNGLDTAGVYQVIFRITASDAKYGDIVRYHQKSFNVRFPDIDQAASSIQVTTVNGQTAISMRPKASNGKFIGPGWGAAISLDAGSAKVQKIVDHGDGSYDLILDGELTGPGSLTIDDEVVYESDLGQLQCIGPDVDFMQRLKCWLIGLGFPIWVVLVILILVVLSLLWLYKLRR